MDERMAVGFIGLGVMGRGMAQGLLRAGHALHVWARRPEVLAPLLQAGAQAHASPQQLAGACRVVVLCLSDDAAVEEVLFGPAGLAAGLAPGSTVVDTSTIAAASVRAFGARLAQRGVALLDAPVSGGQQGAEAGTLTAMVGGDAQVLAACRAVLSAFCRTIHPVGPLGAGQTVKACNQVAVAAALLGVADALALARAQGVDPALAREVLLGGTARSFSLDKHGERLLKGDAAPGFRASLMRKDLAIALRTAAEAGLALAAAPVAKQLLDELCDSGGGERDWSAIGQLVQARRDL